MRPPLYARLKILNDGRDSPGVENDLPMKNVSDIVLSLREALGLVMCRNGRRRAELVFSTDGRNRASEIIAIAIETKGGQECYTKMVRAEFERVLSSVILRTILRSPSD